MDWGSFPLQRRSLQQFVDLVHHSLDPLAHSVALLVEGGDLAFVSLFFALSRRGLALGSFCLIGKLPAQRYDLCLGYSARLSLAFYNLHCPQHFLLERLKLIHTDTGTHMSQV